MDENKILDLPGLQSYDTKIKGYIDQNKGSAVVPAGEDFGTVKSGGDVTISEGIITVNDDSHSHIIENIDGLQSALDGKLSSTGTASKATADAKGQNIAGTYIKGLSVDGKVITYTKGDGSTGTITTQDTNTTYGAAGTSLGLVKSGGDVSISDGVITVNDDTHNHIISNIDGLQSALDGKLPTSGTAASATKLANSRTFSITGGVTASGVSFNGTGNVALNVTSIDPSKISGTIPLSKLPAGALERLVVVDDQEAMYALTTAQVQLGDTVQVGENGPMYRVVDEANLDNATGYKAYTAGSASSVPWSGVTGKPGTFTPAAHTHDIDDVSGLQSALNGKLSTTGTAAKATADSSGQNIAGTYIKGLSVSGRTVTYTKGDGSTGTITTQDTNTTYSNFKGASTSAAGGSGLVPAPAQGNANRYLRSDGTWQVPPDNNTTYGTFKAATSDTAGGSGLVPAPAAGKQSQYLRGDGTWATPTNTTYGAAGSVLGLVKSGGDVTISSGVITVNDDSHNHTIANIDGLQSALDGKLSTSATAAKANALATARNINGMSFDGSANRFNYGTCSTSAGTAAKTVSCAGFSLAPGAEITVKFTVTNTASNPTLNVNSTGAKAIYYNGAAISAGYLKANKTYSFRYNGTQYDLVGDVDTNTTYSLSSLGVTATAAELNKLDGLATTKTELGYLDGVTSNVQTQLNNKLSTSGTAAKATADSLGQNIADTYIKSLSVSGKVITYTRGDGGTGTITTQDTNTTYGAAGTSLGLVKSGGDVTISSGVITVKDDSHNHTIANVDGLQTKINNMTMDTDGSLADTD